MTFTICSTNDFYIQQMTFTFNKKYIYSAIWHLYSVTWDLYSTVFIFVFYEMKFIQLKSSNQIWIQQNIHPKAFVRRKGLVCKLYILSVSIFSFFSEVLCSLQRGCLWAKFCVFLQSYWSMNLCQGLG